MSQKLAAEYKDRQREFYEAVGRAVTVWQMVESRLLEIYVALIRPRQPFAAMASFNSVMSLNARLTMLMSAADEALNETGAELLKKLISKIKKKSKQRNLLAHYMLMSNISKSNKLDVYLAHHSDALNAPKIRFKEVIAWQKEWAVLYREAFDVYEQLCGSSLRKPL